MRNKLNKKLLFSVVDAGGENIFTLVLFIMFIEENGGKASFSRNYKSGNIVVSFVSKSALPLFKFNQIDLDNVIAYHRAKTEKLLRSVKGIKVVSEECTLDDNSYVLCEKERLLVPWSFCRNIISDVA